MPKLREGMKLYHGSWCEVSEPDLSKCGKYKDFGQGLYLTSSKKQAEAFAKISTRRAENRKLTFLQRYGVVSRFICLEVSDINICEYKSADVSWLHCIVGHRRNRFFKDIVDKMSVYDVISGKIANDDTNITITAYQDGLYGEVGTENADNICISLLMPERLKDQYCFRTQKALGVIKFEGSEKVWL